MAHARLLDVAIREFGSKGLDGASTRGIAAGAGTAMSSITYHYGGKEGLYAAVVRHIDADMADDLAPELTGADPAPAPPDARAGIHRMLDLLAAKFLGDEEHERRSLLIMREQMNPTEAFDTFYEGAMGQMAERMAALVRAATGTDEATAGLTAIALFGQVVVWRVSRALADRLLGGPADVARRDAARAMIARNTDCILDRLSAQAQESQ